MNASAAQGSPLPKWTVWRQDDNGNRYIVGHFAEQAAAEAKVAEMEARGHKQLYWVEQYR